MPLNVFVTRHLTPEAEEKLNGFCQAEYWQEETRHVAGLLCRLTDPVDQAVINNAQNLRVVSQLAVDNLIAGLQELPLPKAVLQKRE